MVILGFVAPFLLGFVLNAMSPQSTVNVAPTAQSIPATPTDPNERLELGRKLNGLQGVNFPWHLKASYEVFDTAGKSQDKGTFEEWWVSERRYKLAYHSTQFSQEEYSTDRGIFHSGDAGWPSSPVSLLRRAITEPLPLKVGDNWEQRNLERKLGKTRFVCTALSQHTKNVDESSASFCFEPTTVVLRYSNTGDRVEQTLYNNIVLYRGRLIARDIQVMLLGNSSLSVHIDTVEPLNDADFPATPNSATPITRRVQLLSGEISGHLVKKPFPKYPAEAKAQGVQGMVIINAVISKEGYIQEPRVLAGPQLLQEPAMDAIRQWVYQPYLVDGDPVEIETQINVIFSLSK